MIQSVGGLIYLISSNIFRYSSIYLYVVDVFVYVSIYLCISSYVFVCLGYMFVFTGTIKATNPSGDIPFHVLPFNVNEKCMISMRRSINLIAYQLFLYDVILIFFTIVILFLYDFI